MTLLAGDDFGALFTTFSSTADRLETRDRYSDPVEDEALRRYLEGEPDDLAWVEPWLDQIRRLAMEGKRFRRVRVVSTPLSKYQQWGVQAVARHNIEAGEDIRYLDRSHAADLPTFDYWLFDVGTPAPKAAKLHFDDSDGLLGAEVISDLETILALTSAWTKAYGRALPPDQFAKVHGLG